VDQGQLPDLHAAAEFTSTRPTDQPPYGRSFADYHEGGSGRPPALTWAPWYRDWMTGRLLRLAAASLSVPENIEPDPDPQVGMTPDRWALRSAR
jgi:hypothetical protein